MIPKKYRLANILVFHISGRCVYTAGMNTNKPRTIIVTGGGTGIGKGVAQRFVTAGDNVVLIGRRQTVLESAAQELGSKASWVVADVSDRTSVESAIEQIGEVDVLVNNAGFVRGVSADMPLAEAEHAWDAVIDTNLKGSFLMALAVTSTMPARGGRIINISSIAAYTGGSKGGAIEYAASKAGLHGLTMGLARDLGSRNITVNAVAPGLIAATEFTGHWPQSRFEATRTQQPINRIGQPEDIAGAVYFLASPEARFITGEIVNVNGGWLFGR